jgi:prepilin-type N-terminal cleavage/methylation domain-containing protein
MRLRWFYVGRHRPRRLGQAAYTLVEMAVSLTILSIVVAAIIQGFIAMQFAATGADLRLQNLDQARVLMDTVSKDLRTAAIPQAGQPPFLTATSTHIYFYANLNTTTAPSKVDLYVDSTNPNAPVLIETVQQAKPNTNPPDYAGQPLKTRLVGQYVANKPSQYVFTFYDVNGSSIGNPIAGLTANEMLNVRSIGITLSIRKSTHLNVQPTTLVNRVGLPNVFYSVQASPTP